ncbi:MAG: UbiA family prenyltransferase [Oligoflexales bacterium]|nr:UbiA family prenyltransferase [Oligoflexales bacterium]
MVERLYNSETDEEVKSALSPMYVDFDNSILRSPLRVEAAFVLCRKNLLRFLKLIPSYFFDNSDFNEKLFELAPINIETLPYNQELMTFLRKEYESGRKLIIVSSYPLSFIRRIGEYLGIFYGVLASTSYDRITSKVMDLRLSQEYPDGNYAYVGSHKRDLRLFQKSRESYAVDPSYFFRRLISENSNIKTVTTGKKSVYHQILKASRPHQWVKNFLIYLPLLLSGENPDASNFILCTLGFVSFCFVSSSVYVLNDLLDLNADRLHQDNKKRPFASGNLPVTYAFILIPVYLFLGIFFSIQVGHDFSIAIFWYYILTCLYSFVLKEVSFADILLLASLYTCRIFSGALAAHVPLSNWFLTFSGFFFTSLALLKRTSELIIIKKSSRIKLQRRGYYIDDLNQIVSFGTTSGYISVLVFALYLSEEKFGSQYHNPRLLWLIGPFLIYWISRLWLKAQRGRMTSDPIVFALKDKKSYVVFLCIFIVWFLAKVGYY